MHEKSATCDNGLYRKPNQWFMNVVHWFVTRFMSCISAPLTALYLFWRQRSTMNKQQLKQKQLNERSNFFGSIFEDFVDDATPNDYDDGQSESCYDGS